MKKRETERQRETEIETDRQTDRQRQREHSYQRYGHCRWFHAQGVYEERKASEEEEKKLAVFKEEVGVGSGEGGEREGGLASRGQFPCYGTACDPS